MRTVNIAQAESGIGEEQIVINVTVFPLSLYQEKADLKKVTNALVTKIRSALLVELQYFAERQANLITATTGSTK